MTRNEFIENVTEFYDLRDFCCENDMYNIADELYDSDYLDEIMNDRLRNNYWDDWRSALSDLSDIDARYDWYREDGYGGFEGLTGIDFDDLKQEVLEIGDRDEIWDEEEDEEPDDGEAEEENEVDLAGWMDVLRAAG